MTTKDRDACSNARMDRTNVGRILLTIVSFRILVDLKLPLEDTVEVADDEILKVLFEYKRVWVFKRFAGSGRRREARASEKVVELFPRKLGERVHRKDDRGKRLVARLFAPSDLQESSVPMGRIPSRRINGHLGHFARGGKDLSASASD